MRHAVHLGMHTKKYKASFIEKRMFIDINTGHSIFLLQKIVAFMYIEISPMSWNSSEILEEFGTPKTNFALVDLLLPHTFLSIKFSISQICDNIRKYSSLILLRQTSFDFSIHIASIVVLKVVWFYKFSKRKKISWQVSVQLTKII